MSIQDIHQDLNPDGESQRREPRLNPLFGDMPRYIARQDANWDLMTFDLDKDLALAIKNAGFIESSDPDLSKFKARGGKLLLYHGWADPGPAPENTINYYTAAAKKTGGKPDEWMRLFLLPGVGHCGGGVGPDRRIISPHSNSGVSMEQHPHKSSLHEIGAGQAEMTRPLCPYPQVAKWSGTGSTDDAKNFVCQAK